MKFIDKLNKAVKDNPGAEIKFLVSEETSFDDFDSLYMPECDTNVFIEHATSFQDKLVEREELENELFDDMDFDASEEEIKEFIKEEEKKYIFETIIVVRIG